MGYTHYWYRPLTIPTATMAAIANDFAKLVLPLDDNGVKLANWDGQDTPEVSAKSISFNGPANCGHPQNSNISIPWPSDDAGGLGNNRTGPNGQWFAGVTLQTRCCNGDCSYESFVFPRVIKMPEWKTPAQAKREALENGGHFACCKTAFRPYDIAVTAALIVIKRHMGAKVTVKSDGEDCHWFDAKMLCQSILGYGLEYQLGEKGLEAAMI